MTMQTTFRFVCEKCGRVTLTKLMTDCQFYVSKDGMGTLTFISLCPEHRAELVRLTSDFLGDIDMVGY